MALFPLLILALLFFPSPAHAWGPGVHLQIGVSVLSNLQLIAPAIADIIGRYPDDFLYGCIAADITVGKKFTHYLLHCHRWQTGLRVLERAETEPQKACAYGYLAHLAADTVAHNYYVPYKLMLSFPSLALRHAYWEVKFDTFVDRDVWDVARKFSQESCREDDSLLRSVIADTIFSFRTNKRIFNSILLVSRIDRWQQVVKRVTSSSRYRLEGSDREHYWGLAEEAVFDILSRGEEARCFHADPTGERALAAAERIRKNLRQLYKSGKLQRRQGEEHLREMKEKLRLAAGEPARLLALLSHEEEQSRRKCGRRRGPILI